MIIKTQVNHKGETLNKMKILHKLLKDELWMKNKKRYIKFDLIHNMKLIRENILRISFK